MRTFEHFPKESTCPICHKNTDSECFLLPIDGTQEGNTTEAQPAHTACLMGDGYRYNKALGVIYKFLSDQPEG